MAKRRFIAPRREDVDAAVFAHPIYGGYDPYRDWFIAPRWPSVVELNAAMPSVDNRFVEQDERVLADGLHYETRVGERGEIATRAENWHDLFNAAVWCRYPALKLAFNARHIAHIAVNGPSQRDRAQYAIAQFDEAGAIVCVRDPVLMPLWDQHAWGDLFHTHADAWHRGDIRVVAVVGHALLEMALVPALFPVGKCIVVLGDHGDAACVARVADAIASGRVLNDPLELRPLPLSGIPGWHPHQDATFYATAGCFQPVRAGRVYPVPLS
jgi:hypothetical protein